MMIYHNETRQRDRLVAWWWESEVLWAKLREVAWKEQEG